MTKNDKLIPFGKYKGQPIEVLQADRQYTDWLTQQQWFREKYPTMVNIIVNSFNEPDETPEHNRLQIRFLDPETRVKLAWLVFQEMKAEEEILDTIVRLTADYVDSEGERAKAIQDRREQTERYISRVAEWEAENKREYPFKDAHTYSTPLPKRAEWVFTPSNACPISTTEPQFEVDAVDCRYKYTVTTGVSLNVWGRNFPVHGCGGIAIEAKPLLGDDYPAVLRKMLTTRSRADYSLTHVLVFNTFQSAAIDLKTLKKFFINQRIHAVSMAEIEALSMPYETCTDFTKHILSRASQKISADELKPLKQAIDVGSTP